MCGNKKKTQLLLYSSFFFLKRQWFQKMKVFWMDPGYLATMLVIRVVKLHSTWTLMECCVLPVVEHMLSFRWEINWTCVSSIALRTSMACLTFCGASRPFENIIPSALFPLVMSRPGTMQQHWKIWRPKNKGLHALVQPVLNEWMNPSSWWLRVPLISCSKLRVMCLGNWYVLIISSSGIANKLTWVENIGSLYQAHSILSGASS